MQSHLLRGQTVHDVLTNSANKAQIAELGITSTCRSVDNKGEGEQHRFKQ